MAHCNNCGSEVGCGCNLVEGKCISCYSKSQNGENYTGISKKVQKARYTAPPREAPPLTEFEQILKTDGMSREEKLRRINQILEQAREKYLI